MQFSNRVKSKFIINSLWYTFLNMAISYMKNKEQREVTKFKKKTQLHRGSTV